MRRYTLNISDRQFEIDVQEQGADQFEVVVGGETYQVTLSGDEGLDGATITPGMPVAASAPRAAAAPRSAPAPAASTSAAPAPSSAPAPRPAPGGGGKGSMTAPMPGTILEVNVKPGDTVTRGQQVAILDAMKMHNVLGATQAGTVAEVYVSSGQAVDHGTPILKFKE